MMDSRNCLRQVLRLVGMLLLLTTAHLSLAEHEHHHHHEMLAKDSGYTVTAADYVLPEVELLSRQGTPQKLPGIIGNEPVMLNFIFTTCNAICPIMAATFRDVQNKATKQKIKIKLVSISIDPEQDTPSALQDYARKYHAGDNWEFYTGSKSDIINIQKAFDTYRGNKMNHIPITFIRKDAKSKWIRIEGFASARDLINEFNKATAK